MSPPATDPLVEWVGMVGELEIPWRSVRIACICVRDGTGWVNASGRLQLSLENPSETTEAEPCVEVKELVALRGLVPMQILEQLVSSLRRSEVPATGAYYPIRLFQTGGQSGLWSRALRTERPWSKRQFGIDFASLTCHFTGPDRRRLFPDALRDAIDGTLRTLTDPFDGIDGLARTIGVSSPGQNDLAVFDCVAPIPLRFGKVTQDFRNQLVRVTVEVSRIIQPANLRVNGFLDGAALRLGELSAWTQGGGGNAFEPGAELVGELGHYEKTVVVKPHTGNLRFILVYKGTPVDQHDHLLSPRDPWARAVQYFDERFERSRALLAAAGRLNNVDKFEVGVARLLAIAGLRVIWFGKESAERRPDILAFHESMNGRKTFLLVECTDQKAMNKIDEAARRANDLQKWLDDASCRVKAMIFTPVARKEVDLRAAFELDVALVGAEELRKAWEAIEAGQDMEGILHALTAINLLEHPDLASDLLG